MRVHTAAGCTECEMALMSVVPVIDSQTLCHRETVKADLM